MSLIEPMIAELKEEAKSTRRMLERIPEEHFGYKPHDKSMTLLELACHTVNILDWIELTLTVDEFVFDPESFQPWQAGSKAELLEVFDKHLAKAVKLMEGQPDAAMNATWTMKIGETSAFSMPRAAVMRSMILNHWYHHRGQLSVYLRQKDVPLPQVYGPTADEPDMMPH